MNSKVLKIVLTVLAVCIGLAAVYVVLLNSPYFNVSEIIVSYSGIPDTFLPETERSLSRFYGINLVGLKKSEVKAVLLSQNTVQSASVSKYFPSKLIVDVSYRDFLFRASCKDNQSFFYLVASNSFVPVTYPTFSCFSSLPVIHLDPDYAGQIERDGFDEGFRQAVIMLGLCTSKDLISGILYVNSNNKTFGSLELELESLDSTLVVKDPVTAERLDEALAVIQQQVAQMGGADYNLYASILDRKR